jgi:hypothetical protein
LAVVAKKYRTRPRGPNQTWYEVEVISTERPGDCPMEWLRVTAYPGRYYQGDFRTPDEIARAIPGLELADLEEVTDN